MTSDVRDEQTRLRLSDLAAFVQLLKYAKGWRKYFFFGIALLAVSTFFTILASIYLGRVVDQGIQHHDYRTATYMAVMVILLEFGALIAVYMGRRIIAKSSSYVILNIRNKMFEQIHHLPMSYFDKNPQGRTVTRLTHDVEGLDEFFSSSLGKLGTYFLLATMSFIAMLVTRWQLGIWIALSILPNLLVTVLSNRPSRELNREMSKKASAINAQLSEFIQGLNVVRIFGLENYSQKVFDGKVEEHLSVAKRTNMFYTIFRPITNLTSQIPLLFLLWFGGQEVFAGALSLGLLVTYIRYTERFSNSVLNISMEIQTLQQAFTSAERVAVFLLEKTENMLWGQSFNPFLVERGEIRFENVSMFYDSEKPVLKNISFQIPAGSRVGFLGRTGSGKTTTLSLLAKLYPFQQGDICIDGVSIQTMEPNLLRSQIGFVSQDVVIFNGSLKDNLTCGKEFGEDEIERACLVTGFSEILQKRGFQMNSHLLDQGENLSLGEKQLLSITRIFLQNPRILLLDEATASIDEQLEAQIQAAIEKVLHGRTCIIIAHRLHTIEDCDQLFVFKDGQILAQGNHQELLEKNTYYQNLNA